MKTGFGRRRVRAWRTIVTCVGVLAALPVSAQAAPAAAPWVARHGLTSAQYQAAFDTFTKQGFRLTSVSGYVSGGGVRYAAVWRKVAGPAWGARHGLTAAQYQQAFDAFAKAGYRLTHVSGYEVDGSERYAAIWEQRSGPGWVARHGLTSAGYQAAFDDLTKKGFRLVHVSGYTRGGSPRFAAIFEHGAGPGWVAHHNMTSAGYQQRFDQYTKAGFRLKTVSGYRAAGAGDRYAALWEKVGGPVGRARHGVPLASYQRTFDVDRYQGYHPVAVQAFRSGSTARFNTIWESPFRWPDLEAIRTAAEGFLSKHKVSGLSVALAKDGRLLYASGFGKADKENGVGLDVHHRVRIGSISKPVTSSAIFKLIDDGKLSGVNRRVFGSGGVLSGVTVPASMAGLKNATIAHFLEHTSGLPGAGSGRGLGDPVNCDSGNLSERIEFGLARHAKKAKDDGVSPLLGAPGAMYDYSNFGYVVVERVIEVLAGMSYESYVRSRVLGASGLTRPRLFKVGPYDASSGEAKHYGTDGKYAEYAEGNTCEKEPPGVGAGGWAMSALDLMRYYVSVDGRAGRELLTPTRYGEMVTPATANGGYSRGWILNNWGWCGVGSSIRQGHNGLLAGGFGNLFELGDGYAIAVLGNQNTGAGTCTATTPSGGAVACGGTNQAPCWDDSVGRLVANVLKSVDWPVHDLF